MHHYFTNLRLPPMLTKTTIGKETTTCRLCTSSRKSHSSDQTLDNIHNKQYSNIRNTEQHANYVLLCKLSTTWAFFTRAGLHYTTRQITSNAGKTCGSKFSKRHASPSDSSCCWKSWHVGTPWTEQVTQKTPTKTREGCKDQCVTAPSASLLTMIHWSSRCGWAKFFRFSMCHNDWWWFLWHIGKTFTPPRPKKNFPMHNITQ